MLKAGTISASFSLLENFKFLSTSSFQTVYKNLAEISETLYRQLPGIPLNVPLFLNQGYELFSLLNKSQFHQN